MTLYVVQARGTDDAALEKAHFIAEGFSWGAFVFGWLWLLYRGLWFAFAVWAALEAAFLFFIVPHLTTGAVVLCDLLAHLFIGLEGSRLRQSRGARPGALVDFVEARDRDEAEAVFFGRHAPEAAPSGAAVETRA